MRRKLARRIARRDYRVMYLHVPSVNGTSVSIMNSYGEPIGKPVCIRSLRRANRGFAKTFREHEEVRVWMFKCNGSKRISRSVRRIKAIINRSA